MDDEYQKASEQFERYSYARDNGHLDYVKKADRCDNYFAGNQWAEQDRRKLEAQGRPVLTINKILSTLAVVMGEQLRNRADIAFRPTSQGTQEVADALSKVYIQIANNNDLDHIESDVAADGFITSRGFYDVRIEFDDHMQGEVRIRRINPRNVILDPDASEYDPDTWKEVYITKWLTIDDIELFYGKDHADTLRTKSAGEYRYGHDSAERFHNSFGGDAQVPESDRENTNTRRKVRVIERQYKKLRNAWWFVDVSTGDLRMVPDDWPKEKRERVANNAGLALVKRLAEAIRWTVTADDVVLFDSWSPYKHFTVVAFIPYLHNGRTIGLVENLISPQDQLNKASSQELHIINTTANSGYKVKTGSLQNMDVEDLEERGAETGVVFELNDVNDLEKILPNQVPSGLDRVTYKSDEFIKEISGISDSQRGMDRADVAAKAIQAKQAAGSVNLARPFENLSRTRQILATRVLNLVQTYYTEERLIHIVGKDLRKEVESLTVNQQTPEGTIVNDLTLGEYAVVVSSVPARDDFESTQFQEAVEMRQMGIAVPDDVLVEYSHLDRKKEIADRIREAQGGGEANEAQQQMAQLEMQMKQAEMADRQADTKKKSADAALTMVKARSEAEKAQSGEAASDAQLKREEATATLQLRKYEIDQDMQLRREQADREYELKRDELKQKQRNQLMEMSIKRQAAKQKPKETNNG